jgi:hypothetical protein
MIGGTLSCAPVRFDATPGGAVSGLSLRNGAVSQQLNIFDTYTNPSTYSKGALYFDDEVFTIANAGGNHDLRLTVAGNNSLWLRANSADVAKVSSGGVYLQGATGNFMVQNGGAFFWLQRALIFSPTDGAVRITNNANTNGCTIMTGSAATPNEVVTGSPCDVYITSAGGSGTTFWVKESGTATNTGWVGK